MRATRVALLSLVLSSPAAAGPCDLLNAFQFSPDDTTKCIQEMKDGMALRDLQIRTLQSQVCWLAVSLAMTSSKPVPEADAFIKDACPRRPAKGVSKK